jgi:hypothetical protein
LTPSIKMSYNDCTKQIIHTLSHIVCGHFLGKSHSSPVRSRLYVHRAAVPKVQGRVPGGSRLVIVSNPHSNICNVKLATGVCHCMPFERIEKLKVLFIRLGELWVWFIYGSKRLCRDRECEGRHFLSSDGTILVMVGFTLWWSIPGRNFLREIQISYILQPNYALWPEVEYASIRTSYFYILVK